MAGNETTVPITLDAMIYHARSVVRAVERALVVVDLPFGTYQGNSKMALDAAIRIMKETEADAVKLEGGAAVCEQIRAIVDAGIPVCAHLGLTPQSINAFGGHKVQGKSAEAAREILEDAKRIEEAGAFAVVLECIPADLARKISETISIPTIGIGAGPGCDGQVLVYQDMLALFSDFKPKFVKNFANIGEQMTQAFKDYDAEVKANTFPASEHCFKDVGEEVLDKLY